MYFGSGSCVAKYDAGSIDSVDSANGLNRCGSPLAANSRIQPCSACQAGLQPLARRNIARSANTRRFSRCMRPSNW